MFLREAQKMRVDSDAVRVGLPRIQGAGKLAAAAVDADGFREVKSFAQTYEHSLIRAFVSCQWPEVDTE